MTKSRIRRTGSGYKACCRKGVHRPLSSAARRVLVPASRVASSGKGWWRLSHTRSIQEAMSNDWFAAQGLLSFHR